MNRRRRLTHRILRRVANYLRAVAPTDWPISVSLRQLGNGELGACHTGLHRVVGPRGAVTYAKAHKIVVCRDLSAKGVPHTLIHEWAHALLLERHWASSGARAKHYRDRTQLDEELYDHNDEFWQLHGELYRAMVRFDHGAAA